jgi:GNAT superfamily N-acetyltransferase
LEVAGSGRFERDTRAHQPYNIAFAEPKQKLAIGIGFAMLSIRPATINDVSVLNAMVHELAEYDRLSHEALVTEEDLARDGFGAHPKFRAVMAEWNNEPAGYALFFEFYSTFQGRTGLFLDDIFVRPKFRKKGIGRALLDHVAQVAWREKYFCVRWEVLNWNTPAINFYSSLGAVFMDDWKSVCLIGDALETAAQESGKKSDS